MMTNHIQSWLQGLSWPESPRWHDNSFWFADVHNFRVMRAQAQEDEPDLIVSVPGRPAGMGFMPDGRLVVGSALDRKLWMLRADGTLELLADFSPMATGVLNDLVVDHEGRVWVGDTGFNLQKGEPRRPGRLFTWAPGDAPKIAAEELEFPNGIAIAADGRTLYLAETFGERISAFQVHDGGRLDARKTHCSLDGKPDGICMDSQGALWVALVMAGQFVRILINGEVSERIDVAPRHAISCVLGDPDRRTLFLGTSLMDESDPSNVIRHGSVARVRVMVPGTGSSVP